LRETLALKTQQGKVTFQLPTPSSSTVQTVPPRPPTAWAKWVAATVGLALLGGGTAAWMHNRATTNASAPDPLVGPPVVPDGPIVTKQRLKEQFLREAVEEYSNPGPDRDRRDLGIRHNRELALFYLKENRLEDADEFFRKLIENPARVPAYRTLGRLGHAIVLARQDRTAESIALFQELLTDKPKAMPPQIQFLLNQPELRVEISRAMEYNKANLRNQPLPPELENLREPPRLPAKPPAAAPGKK
ncbi:MAG TPA: hypothetical protein VKU02_34035, partial [Gemmataceae bacterium]|nr:hypothetical protein [Gemmataceae bacterium]